MQRTIKIKKFLPYAPALVWRTLTDAELLGQWFMKNNLVPEVGQEFTFVMAPQKGWDGITHCQVTALHPMNLIQYTYRGEASGEKTLACAGIRSDAAQKAGKGIFTKLDTVVSFQIEPTCSGTILHLSHAGYKGFQLVLVSFIMQMGWKKQLGKKLPKVLSEMC